MNYYDTELFHSETYLGADYSDGLQHFKYIKRYRNARGKWTYVYANRSTHRSIRGNLQNARMHRDRQNHFATEHTIYSFANSIAAPDDKTFSDLSMRSMDNVYRDRENADYHEKEAWREINQYSLNRLAKEKVDKGTSIINNLFSKLRKGGK